MKTRDGSNVELANPAPGATVGGWAGRLMARLRRTGRPQPQLRLLERIAISPRLSLALVEAEGRRFLLATSGDGAPAFYPLDEPGRRTGSRRASYQMHAPAARTPAAESYSAARVSW